MNTKRRLPRPTDLKQFEFVSDPQVSPDGTSILFVLTKPISEGENGDYSSNIWKFSNGRTRPLTSGNGKNTNPRWSPDGKTILFVSSRKAKSEKYTRLRTVPIGGGHARTILEFNKERSDVKIKAPKWTPDGKKILFLSDLMRRSNKDSDVKVVTRIAYRRNAEGYFHDRRTHLYSIKRTGGKANRLTSGEWDVDGYSISEDGSKVALIANMTGEADYSLVRDIHVMPATGGTPVKITSSKGPIEAVSWSHDSKKLAYVGHDLRRRLATTTGIWIAPARRGTGVEMTMDFDRPVGNKLNSDSRVASPDPGPVWGANDRGLTFLATDGGSCHIYKLDLLDRSVEAVTQGERSVEGFSFSKDRKVLAYTAMDSLSLADIFARDENGEKQITSFSNKGLGKLQLSAPESFVFKASDGVSVEGWVMRPFGPRRDPVATVVEIHGGPRTAYGHCFMFEFQLLAASGFAVLFTNPRGSTAYGEEFAAKIPKNYGDRDYKDIMESLNYLIRAGVADEKRLGVAGGSYGGFMTNWIVGHTAKFKAAITERSISNWNSFFGSSDIGYFFAEEEVGGVPWENIQRYLENSPLTYVRNVNTPLLIIHSEEDYRCPIEQGEQLFVALRKLRKEAVMIRFPEENHELSRSGKPRHRIERLNHITKWFKDHLLES